MEYKKKEESEEGEEKLEDEVFTEGESDSFFQESWLRLQHATPPSTNITNQQRAPHLPYTTRSYPNFSNQSQPDSRFADFNTFQTGSAQPFTLPFNFSQTPTSSYHSPISHYGPQPVGPMFPTVSNLEGADARQLYHQMLQQRTVLHEIQRAGTQSNFPSIHSIALTNSSSRFALHEQPSPRQRKSRRNENRFLVPNPLTICPREGLPEEKLPKILGGYVTLKLANKDGEILPEDKQRILVVGGSGSGSGSGGEGRASSSSIDEEQQGNTKQLDNKLCANYSIKVTETSQGKTFRLLFIVLYRIEGMMGGEKEERILSHPFLVFENRAKSLSLQPPVVIDMKPQHGTADTEVWIKGKGFGEQVRVDFDDKTAKILDSADNLITATVPSFDFTAERTLTVVTSNKISTEEFLTAEKKLNFVYYPQGNDGN